MHLQSETFEAQSLLADYCRTGIQPEIQGTNKHISRYRELVYNVVYDTLENAYPITFKLLQEETRNELVHVFFSNHKAQTPQVWKLPFEFYRYLIENSYDLKLNLPFLKDLLYFEWLEIELYNMEDLPLPEHKPEGDWLNEIIIVNPETKIVQFEYPVHLTSPENLIQNKGLYFLLAYRDLETREVEFVNLSGWYALVVEQLLKAEFTLQEILEEAGSLFPETAPKELSEYTVQFLKDMQEKQFVLGFAVYN
jgi:hypothetical protein